MTYQHFTANEIATAIQELGFQAKIFTDEDQPKIESASSGARWTAQLCGSDPFFNSMFLHTPIWIKENPLQWVNNWNSCHWSSMAHVVMPDDDTPLVADEDGDYMIMVNFTYDFEGGVSHNYLEHAFTQWLRTIDELSELEDIKICPARSPQSSRG